MLNIELEREVRRRTEVLERRNKELHDALEKLRRAQDDLMRSEKLASMGRLVAGIAHEINNPVNAVINTLGPLEEALAAGRRKAEAPRRGRRRAGDVERDPARRAPQQGDRAGAAQLLARRRRARASWTLARSIDDTLDLLRHRLKGASGREADRPGLRSWFAGQIDQVFMNLITNAAQAIGEHGRGGTIHIAAARATAAVEITIADNGPGHPAEVLPRIFDPFFTTKDVGEGSGLGLWIVHGIVERHGGHIEVQSRVGEGTTFRSRCRSGAGPRAAPDRAVLTKCPAPWAGGLTAMPESHARGGVEPDCRRLAASGFKGYVNLRRMAPELKHPEGWS